MQVKPKQLERKVLKFINNFNSHKKPNLNIYFEKEGKNLEIIKNEKNVIIKYQFEHQIFHAVSLIYNNLEKNEFNLNITSKFNEMGVMLDVARNAVPKIQTLKEYIKILASLGYTYLGLYLEDIFHVEEEDNFGYMRGRYTILELKELDLYASEFGIEIVPFIQTLAHLNSIFRHQEYDEINDLDDILLAGNERTYSLIENMLKTISTTFMTKRINIGMDEAWQLGLGKYLKLHGFTSKTEIMKNHLEKVLILLEKYNFKAEMWADMYFVLSGANYHLDEPVFDDEIKKSVPKNIKLIYWDYDDRDIFDHQKRYDSIKELTNNYGFAGGAHKWLGFAPKNHYSLVAISNSTKAALNNNVSDYLLTAWGDNGGEASHFSILPSLIHLSAINYSDKSINNYQNQFAKLLTNYNFQELLSIDLPNILYDHKKYELTNPSKYLLYEDILMGSFYYTPNLDYEKRYKNIKNILKKLSERESKYNYIFKTLSSLSEVLENKSTLSLKILKAYQNNDLNALSSYLIKISQINQSLNEFKELFEKQWYFENKSYGFEIQSYRLGGLQERLKRVKIELELFIKGEINKIEVLEERKLFYNHNNLNETLFLNKFTQYISPSDI